MLDHKFQLLNFYWQVGSLNSQRVGFLDIHQLEQWPKMREFSISRNVFNTALSFIETLAIKYQKEK
jgi:hypothetical protein